MKKRVALLYGGDSSEFEVSVKSGKNVASAIDRQRYDLYQIVVRDTSWAVQIEGGSQVEVDKSDFSAIIDNQKIKFDLAFIMIHGTPGENGLLQAYFEMLHIPHNTCSSFVSALTFDKYACKAYLRDLGIKLPKESLVRKGDSYSPDEIVERLGLPLFVKPNIGGSSFGATKVNDVNDIPDAIERAFVEGDTVIVEEYIKGREVTNGVYMRGRERVVLPVTEIIPDNEFFDYQAKYLGASKEICPAEIDQELYQQIREETSEIYHYLGCRGLVRMDYIVRDGEIYFLEINVVPGMTQMSLVPQQVACEGMTMKEFMTILIEQIISYNDL